MFIRHFAVETLPRGRTKPTPSWRALLYPVEMVVGQEQKNKTASCYAHFDDLRPIVDIGRNARKVKLESLNMPRSVSIEIMGAPKIMRHSRDSSWNASVAPCIVMRM
jgi:hypothetical protein